MQITRRNMLVLLSATSVLALGSAGVFAAEGDTYDQAKLLAAAADKGLTDHVLGSETAPVTLIEYASPSCPHCAAFSNDVFPILKAQYIDTGKVKFILRPFVRNILDVAIFMVAEAAGAENYYNVVETYFRTQLQWADPSKKPKDEMMKIAQQLGFTDATFDAALTNQALYTALDDAKNDALETFKLEGTPTFYVNGKQLTGEKTLEQLAAEIDPLIPADFVPTQAATPVAPAPATTTTPAAPATTTTPAAPATETFTPVAPATPAQ